MSQEVQATAASTRPRRAKGEVQVWLTAVGLSTGLIMIIGLLGLILWNGITVFWPKPVVEFALREADGKTTAVAGEVVKTRLRPADDGSAGKEEIQIFTGNKDAYGLAFRFIDGEAVTGRTEPRDLILAERMEYGDSLFYPIGLDLADGSRVEVADEKFDETFSQLVREAGERRREILHIEKKQIGRLNERIRSEEMAIRRLERSGGGDPAPHQAAIEAAQKEYEALAAEARRLRAEQESNILRYRLASGEERTQKLGDFVHYYRPNDLSWFGRLGVFSYHFFEFITGEPREANTEGGIFPAIFGTFVMTILMAVMVSPLGVIAAIYLREYAAQGLMVRIVRICVNNLAGVPSIVFGVFGLGFFVYGVGSFIDGGTKTPMPAVAWWLSGLAFIVNAVAAIVLAMNYGGSNPNLPKPNAVIRFLKPFTAVCAVLFGIATLVFNPYFDGFYSESLPTPTFGTGGILWASLTLALMTLPVVIVATEEALAAVPRGVREAALACGASKWQMIQRVVLPSALPGVMTGVILAMARGAGEVAPLMITGVVKLAPSLPIDLSAPFIHAERKFMHLGFHIYDLGFQSPDSEGAKPMVFATTLFLILLVVVMNLTAIRIRTQLKKKYQASAF
ncbi:MAG: ABC transporter permease subunit [Verrucomicrobiales bacterium]|nr:ABC transporter permease subunit [Verrucomicrobiales bacterium]